MKKSDLLFEYPSHLIATERKAISRVMLVSGGEPQEVTAPYILTQIEPGDVLVVNNTKVIPARVVTDSGLEILFIHNLSGNQWEVLCPVRRWKGEVQKLPGGIEARLVQKGRPQVIELSQAIDQQYFMDHGDVPLPPYIQEARGERRSRMDDRTSYQTDWAQELGSLAAPTASLHFSNKDLEKVKMRGAEVLEICLHVGLGTFLPIYGDSLDEHKMHDEQVVIPSEVWQKVKSCRQQGGRVWALGSTVTRALESQAKNYLQEKEGVFAGATDLFIRPGFEFQVVDVLLTNFHQPESTLIAMVMAFAGVDEVKKAYQWAIERQFRLFSYGDLSVWMK